MKHFLIYTKKELIEHVRTYKLLILAAVFLILAMISPLLAKMMPDIFKSLEFEGLIITIPEPTYIDAYTQFFKNMTQIGFICILLVFSGILSQEIARGTLIIILSKGLPRSIIIIAKFIAAALQWTIIYAAAALVNHLYTLYFFDVVSSEGILFSIFCLWLFGIFVLALLMFASAVTSANYGGLLLSGLILVILIAVNIFPGIQAFNPVSLAAENIAIMTQRTEIDAMLPSILSTSGLSIVFLVLAIQIFKHKQL